MFFKFVIFEKCFREKLYFKNKKLKELAVSAPFTIVKWTSSGPAGAYLNWTRPSWTWYDCDDC